MNPDNSYNPNNVFPEYISKTDTSNKVLVKDRYIINDIRSTKELRGVSFSNYKKSDVKKQLLTNLLENKLEGSCYWAAELLCAGHFTELWEIILYFMSKHIHLGNPRISNYLEMRYKTFRNIMNKNKFLNELDVRNDEECRKLFAEIMITLSLSSRKMSFEEIKINSNEDFDMIVMKEKLKATSMDFANSIFKKKDPKEIFIALNEFCFHISNDSKNITNACYWYEWVIELEANCKKNKNRPLCEPRDIPVETVYRSDVVWVFWDAIFFYGEMLANTFIMKILPSLLRLFCIRYTTASCRRRRFLIYYAISLLIEKVPVSTEIIENKQLLKTALTKINLIYKQIKKNEISPNTDYLFNNLEKQNTLDQSLKQMELMNEIDNINFKE